MAKSKITIFYAWQSDLPSKINRHFIRKALNDAAERMTSDLSLNVEVIIDADTEGVVGTPDVTETILNKIKAADIFVPDLTFVATTKAGKHIPNPNVLIEYGYALKALTFEAMMPVMNTCHGGPDKLPFDLNQLRYPTQYNLGPDVSDAERRASRDKLSAQLESHLRAMALNILSKARGGEPFTPKEPVRPPAFFFQLGDVIANFGNPGEQELRFKRDRAIYLRVYPAFRDQPKIGRKLAKDIVTKLLPLGRTMSPLTADNNWGSVSLEPHGDGIASFTQIFDTGELWGVSEQPFRSKTMVGGIGVEKSLSEALDNYRSVYERDLQMRPPIFLEFGIIGLTDHYLAVPSLDIPGGHYAHSFKKTEVVFKKEVKSFKKEEWQGALREFALDLYDAALISRGDALTDQIIKDHGLPPR